MLEGGAFAPPASFPPHVICVIWPGGRMKNPKPFKFRSIERGSLRTHKSKQHGGCPCYHATPNFYHSLLFTLSIDTRVLSFRVFAKLHPCAPLSFPALPSISRRSCVSALERRSRPGRDCSPKSNEIISFADPHPVTPFPSIFYKNRWDQGGIRMLRRVEVQS